MNKLFLKVYTIEIMKLKSGDETLLQNVQCMASRKKEDPAILR